MMTDDDLLPPEDKCAVGGFYCGKKRAEHIWWQQGGPSHEFVAPEGKPNPERFVTGTITTDWDCGRCGAHNDVWGAATEWMECAECSRYSYLVPFEIEPTDQERTDSRP